MIWMHILEKEHTNEGYQVGGKLPKIPHHPSDRFYLGLISLGKF